jgi:oligoribonuclease NrnB/cAMP/cGMP phosphodiesterase (DHH superfamily)
MKTYVLYHAQCPDGFGAAYSIWKKFKDKFTYIPVNHNQPLPQMDNQSTIWMVDFCYPADILKNLTAKMHKITVLDHHKSAEEDVKRINLAEYPNLEVHFDMQKSGAVITWEHFHQTEAPFFLKYIEDKDLWLFKLPKSKEFSAGLRAYPMDFATWDRLTVEQLIMEGDVLLRYQNQLIDKLCKNMRFGKVAGYEVPIVNSPTLQSEIGNQLCKLYPQSPFAVVYFEAQERRHFSLRSLGDFDVAAVAAKFGGGGHKNASGFVQSIIPWEV